MSEMTSLALALLLVSGRASAAVVVSQAGAAPAGAVSAAAASAGAGALALPAVSVSAPSLSLPLTGAAPLSAPAASALSAQPAGFAPSAIPLTVSPAAAAPAPAAAKAVRAAPAVAVRPAASAKTPRQGRASSPKSAVEQAAAPAPAGESAEAQALRSETFFDQAGVYENLGREEPLAPEAADILRAVHTPPPPTAGDDGGGPDYPHRDVAFNGQTFPSVAFRPNTGVEALIIAGIDASKKTIKIALYEFSSRNILVALQKAKRRGVKVQVILDDSNAFPENEPGADYRRRRSEQIWGLVRDGFDLRILRGVTEFGINHNKFAVFDGKMAEFGSYNWSYTSEHSHYENANFSTEPKRVKGLDGYWDYLWTLSVPEKDARNHVWPETVPAPPADPSPSIAFNGIKLPLYVFTPGDKLEDALVAAIDAAKVSVDYAMFSPRSTKVVEALKRAAARPGVTVRAVIDESQSKSEYFKPYVDWLGLNGVQVRTLSGPNGPESDFPMAEKMHNKFMILDGKLVETGSANHTKRASMDNYENAQFLDDGTDVAGFEFHFKHLWAVSSAYEHAATASIPTDAQLREDILHPTVKPAPPAPDLPPLPAATSLTFRGRQYPTTAFRPYEPVVDHIVAAIDAAQSTLRISIYQFEQRAVMDALLRAQKRKVKIEVVLDRSHVYTTGTSHEGGPRRPRPMVVELVKAGFDLLLLKGQGSGIMHNKFLIVDDQLLEGGSYNYTDQSETDHFENAYFTLEKERVALYLRYFKYMREQAEPVDMDKLEEILTRTTAGAEETAQDLESADAEASKRHPDPDGRTSKYPAPPKDEASPIDFHGEKFPRAIFSPQGGIEDALVRAIGAAKKTIDIAMFSFYSRRIAEALLAAKEKNPSVVVRLVLDKSQASLSSLDDWFAWHDFDMRVVTGPDDTRDPLYQKMHNKYGVFDGELLETGSFNYSPNAEKNSFENSNWFDVPEIAARYTAFFERMFTQGVKPRKPKREPKFKDADSVTAES